MDLALSVEYYVCELHLRLFGINSEQKVYKTRIYRLAAMFDYLYITIIDQA